MAHMIEMRKVSKFYSQNNTVNTGFSRVSLDLDIGDFVVITGESGSGKSTLLNVISGLDTYEEGEMFVNGEDTGAYTIEDYEEYRKTYIGNIFQDFNLINSYTVYQNVELVLLLNGHRKGVLREGIMKILDWVGMKEYARTKVSKLSGGQKQRVAIARAFARNAPIIVADEPTGNLDSESALRVMEILAAMARDRLVIVVTHNYEQAAPYATRKIMMRDGRIIEDNRLRPSYLEETGKEEAAPKEDGGEEKASSEEAALEEPAEKAAETAKDRQEKIEKRRRQRAARLLTGSRIRLGIRNAFNLPAKFLLLLFIYLFVTAAVVGTYTSLQMSAHASENLNEAEYFFDSSPQRMILKKKDKTAFSGEEVAWIRNNQKVDHVALNDLALDRLVSLDSERLYVEGPVYSVSTLKAGDLAYGRLPQKDDEIVVGADDTSDSYESLKGAGKKLLGKKYYLQVYDTIQGEGARIGDTKCTIVGVTFKKAEAQKVKDYGYSRFYVGDQLANKMLVANVAATSDAEFRFQGMLVSGGNGQSVCASAKVRPGGAVLIYEDAQSYFKEGKAQGKKIQIRVSNRYFTSKANLKVTKVVTPRTIKQELGISRRNYDTYVGTVFVSREDYAALFDKGYYQISAFVKDDRDSEEVAAALDKAGFEVLPMKSLLENGSGDLEFVGRLIRTTLMVLMFVILFFIAYTVIRLIMRSRNTYYSTLRILGATRKNTRSILRTELLVIMFLAAGIGAAFLQLVQRGIIRLPMVKAYLAYMELQDYGILLGVMLIMSLMIASRYSRKIFSQSAMGAYRGGEPA